MALVLAPEAPADEWLAALDAQIEKSPSFFEGRPVIVDLAVLPREQPNVAGLIEALRQRGIRIIGTEGAHPSWPGLEKWGPPLSGGRTGARPVEVPTASQAASDAPPAPPPARDAASIETPSAPAAATLVIDHSVRSGQSVVSERGDVVVIGSVASGAEIMAGGSIHVYGTLRGRAVAGVSGNPGARIFCSKLQAELLAIDGLYRTAEDLEPALKGRSVMAWLDGEAMKIEPVD